MALVLIGISPETSLGNKDVFSKENFIRVEKKQLERRFKGFFEHIKQKKIYDIKRKANLESHKIKRQQLKDQQEARRLKYISQRKEKKSIDIDALMAARLQRRAKIREKLREGHRKFRAELEYLRNTTRKIPENIDVGLEKMK